MAPPPPSAEPPPAGETEPLYASAKTSVWWDMENCHVPRACDPHLIAQNIYSALLKMNYRGTVSISAYGDTNKIPSAVQNALSSTGVSLNHVPAGVKDASDKKILVDMLFWAVDNPAPANYLLISGDRDFSNALHQLRMRRYNILLAQPQKASAPLIAAAKSVWLWTSLLAGGNPLSNCESSQLANSNYMISPELLQDNNSYASNFDSLTLGNQKFPSPAKPYFDDGKYKAKYIQKHSSQPISRASSMPVGFQESENNKYMQQPEPAQAKQFKKAPHEFFSSNDAKKAPHEFFSANDTAASTSKPTPSFFAGNLDSSSSGNDAIESSPNPYPHLWRANNHPMQPRSFPLQLDEELKPNSSEPSISASFNRNLDSSSSSALGSDSSNGVWGTQGCRQPSEYVQGLIGVVLLALSTLKVEKMMPTETNITDCIRHGDLKHRNTDVRKALDSAVEQNMVVKQYLGAVHFYIGKNDRLWKCVNPISGNPNQYPKATCDGIHNFLKSDAGNSAIMASQSKYEAALILRNACLEELSLGDVLQILNVIITFKNWIRPHPSGWQPIVITIAEASATDAGTSSGA